MKTLPHPFDGPLAGPVCASRPGSAVPPAAGRGAALATALLSSCLGMLPVHAQVTPPRTGATGAQPLSAPAAPGGDAAATAEPVRVAAPGPARSLSVEPSITIRATGTDNSGIDSSRKAELYFEVMPRLNLRSNGPRHRLNAMLGADHVTYTRDSYPERTDPVASISLNSVLVQNALFLDAGADVARRAISPFGSQSANAAPTQQVREQVLRLSPYLQMKPSQTVDLLVRTDNTQTKRSGEAVNNIPGTVDKVYSRNSQARLQREPLPFGVGIELGEQALEYNDDEVLRLENALVTLGYAFNPQFTLYALGGVERSRYAATLNEPLTHTDSDKGLRLRWAPMERSVITAEARQRFFGNSYNAQWNHRSRFVGLRMGFVREPYTQPETLKLAGDLATQFDAIFRSRGFNAVQREALVQSTLAAYGLPDSLANPVNLYVPRAQLSSTSTAELSFMGRRTAAILSAYKRRLEPLHRDDDPVAPVATLGDTSQTGGQARLIFRLTPMVSLEAAYRHDRSQGMGILSPELTKENTLSLGTSLSLSPRTRVGVSVQRQEIESAAGGGQPIEANSAAVTMIHRF